MTARATAPGPTITEAGWQTRRESSPKTIGRHFSAEPSQFTGTNERHGGKNGKNSLFQLGIGPNSPYSFISRSREEAQGQAGTGDSVLQALLHCLLLQWD